MLRDGRRRADRQARHRRARRAATTGSAARPRARGIRRRARAARRPARHRPRPPAASAFAIGTETSGSILSPSARCGVAGLRPTFGRISRHGVMALSWTQDRLGPICRYAEDCALVMQAIARPDGRDMSVTDLPFNWDAEFDIRTLSVGIIQESFDEITDPAAKANAQKTLETLKAIGVKRVHAGAGARVQSDVSAIGVESAVFFDEHARAGRMKDTRRRAADRTAGAGGRLPAVAARPHDDDDGAGRSHRARRRLHRRRPTTPAAAAPAGRTGAGAPGRAAAATHRPQTPTPAPLPHGQPRRLPGGEPAQRLRRRPARRPTSCSTRSRTANIRSWRWPRPTRTRPSGTCGRRPRSTRSGSTNGRDRDAGGARPAQAWPRLHRARVPLRGFAVAPRCRRASSACPSIRW